MLANAALALQAYVNNLNAQVKGKDLANMTLEQVGMCPCCRPVGQQAFASHCVGIILTSVSSCSQKGFHSVRLHRLFVKHNAADRGY